MTDAVIFATVNADMSNTNVDDVENYVTYSFAFHLPFTSIVSLSILSNFKFNLSTSLLHTRVSAPVGFIVNTGIGAKKIVRERVLLHGKK